MYSKYIYKFIPYLFLTIISVHLAGCSLGLTHSEIQINNGFYEQARNSSAQQVYLHSSHDTINVYAVDISDAVDTLKIASFPKLLSTSSNLETYFSTYSFDAEILTMPATWRLPQRNIASQINSSFNLALYLGIKTDKYSVSYQQSPLKQYERGIRHFRFSLGAFSGIGNTFISPTTTNFKTDVEYDGVVWNKGIAGSIGVNDFTFGLAIGAESLLSDDSSIWLYQRKPWLAFAVGFNLN